MAKGLSVLDALQPKAAAPAKASGPSAGLEYLDQLAGHAAAAKTAPPLPTPAPTPVPEKSLLAKAGDLLKGGISKLESLVAPAATPAPQPAKKPSASLSVLDKLAGREVVSPASAKARKAVLQYKAPLAKGDNPFPFDTSNDGPGTGLTNSFGGTANESTPSSTPNQSKGSDVSLSKLGDYLYNQVGGLLLPGSSKEELHSPTFLYDTAASAPSAAFKIGKQIITHPLASTYQATAGIVKGVSDVAADIIVNNLVPKDKRPGIQSEVHRILDQAFAPPSSLKTDDTSIESGFETAGQTAPAIVAGAIGGAAGEALGPLGQLFGEAGGFTAVGQAELPIESTPEERAQQVMDSFVQLGLFKAGSYAYHVTDGMVRTSIEKATGIKLPVPRGMVKNPFYREPGTPEGEANALAPIEEKAAAAKTADEFHDSLTPQEKATVIRSEGTDQHLNYDTKKPIASITEPVPDAPGLEYEPETGKYYYNTSEEHLLVDTKAAAADYFEHHAGQETGGFGTDLPTEREKVVKTKGEIQTKIDDLQTVIDVNQEQLDTLPAKDLLKYYGRHDPKSENLDNIFARNVDRSTGAKSSKLDDIVTEKGFDDVQHAHEGVLRYVNLKEAQVQAKTKLKELKTELKNTALPEVERPQPQWIRRPLYAKPARRAAPTETTGDYLRRGAIRADVQERVDARGVIQGQASTETQRNALLEATDGGIEHGPFKGMSMDMKNWFQRFVHGRQTAAVETRIVMQSFDAYKKAWDKQGLNLVFKYEGMEPKGDTVAEGGKDHSGPLLEIEHLLDQWLREEQAAGVPVRERQGYLPLYLADEGDASPGLPGRRLGLRPGFTMSRFFDSYAEAIAAGKTPKYTSMYDIIQARAQAHFKAVADAKFFNEGVSKGYVVPKTAVDDEFSGLFRDLDSERFPNRRAAYGNTVYSGVYAAPEPVAEKVNNYLRDPDKWLKRAADLVGSAKGMVMSVGIPGTAINPHLFNILPREIFADLAISPVTAPREFGRAMLYTIAPKLARRYIAAHLEEALPLLRNGMTYSAEGMDTRELFNNADETLMGKMGTVGKALSKNLHNIFGGNMFGGLIPARKIYNGLRIMKAYEKSGLSTDEAAQKAADAVNKLYGGMNIESMGRNKNFQNFLRTVLFAPDYAETNLKLGADTLRGVFKPGTPGFNLYGRFMFWFVGAYVAANIINHENSGKWMWENDPIHSLDLATGKDDQGKTRYWKIFGTGVDWIRLPMQIATAITQNQGNPGEGFKNAMTAVRNRLSTIAGPALSLIANSDYRGDPIFGVDAYGKPQSESQQAINVFNNSVGAQLPGSINTLLNYAKGTQSLEQTVTQASGLPLSYKSNKPTVADINNLKTQAAADIKNGDYKLFNELVKAGAIAPRSKATFIRTALSGPTIREQKSKAKTKAKTDKVKINLENLGL